MNHKIILSFLLIIASSLAFAQNELNFQWAKTNSGNSPETTVFDNNGNYYVVGNFSDSVDSDFGPGKSMYYTSNYYGTYIAKYDASGNFIWSNSIEGNGLRNAVDVYLNHEQNSVYVLGQYSDSVYGDPANNIQSRASAGGYDLFIARFNTSNGALQRISSMGGSNLNETPSKGLMDKNGNQYILWRQRANSLDYITLTKITPELTTAYNYDMSTAVANLGYLSPNFLKLDTAGNAYIMGTHNNGLFYKNAAGKYSSLFTDFSNTQSVFVIKVNSLGRAINVKQFKLFDKAVVANNLEVSPNGEFAASFSNSTYNEADALFPNISNAYIAKHAANFEEQWTIRVLTPESNTRSMGLAIDKNNNVYVGGQSGNNVQLISKQNGIFWQLFDSGTVDKTFYTDLQTETGGSYLLKINPQGNLIWFKNYQNKGNDNFKQIHVNDNFDLYTTGRTYDTLRPVAGSNNNEIEVGDIYFWYLIKNTQTFPANVKNTHSLNNTLSVYPNPSQDFLNISSEKTISKIEIYNVNGIKVLESHQSSEPLNVREFSNGLYFIKAYSENQILQSKFVVNH